MKKCPVCQGSNHDTVKKCRYCGEWLDKQENVLNEEQPKENNSNKDINISSLINIRKAAEQGDAGAQFSLGWMYEIGKGVPQDYSEAAKWYRKAAEQGLGSAQSNLGVMYEIGKGVPQDYSEAAKWYRKAAEQGDTDAQLRLYNVKDK
jgi:hypothetical protein